jgi:hypothetical protein
MQWPLLGRSSGSAFGWDRRSRENDPLDTFSYVVRELDRRRIGCLTLLKPNEKDLERASRSSTSPKRLVP